MKGKILKQLRQERGITQEELAKYLGVARSLIGMVEAERQEGGRKLALKCSEYFDVSIDYLEGLTDNRNKTTKERDSLVTDFLKFLVNNNIIKDIDNIDDNTKELIINIAKKEIELIKENNNNE